MKEKSIEAANEFQPPSPKRYKGIFSAEPKYDALTEFHLFPKLVPELHDYILTFCTNKQLFNFAQCSSVCNQEIQRFNTAGPHRIRVLYDDEDSMTRVLLIYKHAYNRPFVYRCKPMRKSEFGFTVAAKIIENALKLVKSLNNNVLDLHVPIWPKTVLNIDSLKKLVSGRFSITTSMIKDFSEFLNQSQMKRLVLEPACRRYGESWNLPASFFKSPGFKRLDCAVLKMGANIEEEDFMSSTARVLHIGSHSMSSNIDGVAFNKKILQWFENPTQIDVDYDIYNRSSNAGFNKNTLTNGLPLIDKGSRTEFDIRRSDGLVGTLHIWSHYDVKFYTRKFNEYEVLY